MSNVVRTESTETNGSALLQELVTSLGEQSLARLLNIDTSDVSQLQQSQSLSSFQKEKLDELARAKSMIEEVLHPDVVIDWLTNRKPARLTGLTPLQAIAEGKSEIVYEIIAGLASGD